MTAQIHEKVIYKGEVNLMASEPLGQYLRRRKIQKLKIRFSPISSSCWRGYNGTWKIEDDKLYLVDFIGYICDQNEEKKEVGLDYLFSNASEVFAEWFTGVIRIPIGNRLEYIHMAYLSIYEKDLFLTFDKGILIDERLIDNRPEFNKI